MIDEEDWSPAPMAVQERCADANKSEQYKEKKSPKISLLQRVILGTKACLLESYRERLAGLKMLLLEARLYLLFIRTRQLFSLIP